MKNSYTQRWLTVQGQKGHWTKYSWCMLSGEDGQGNITVTSEFYVAIFSLSFSKAASGCCCTCPFEKFWTNQKEFRGKQREWYKSRKHDLWGWERGSCLISNFASLKTGERLPVQVMNIHHWKFLRTEEVKICHSFFYFAFILYWEMTKCPVGSHPTWFSTVRICRERFLSSGSGRNKSPGRGPCFYCNLLWWSVASLFLSLSSLSVR